MSEITKELVAASSRSLILSILLEKQSYGYEILQTVTSLTEGQWNWTDGMIYPLLRRLENEKLITSHWKKVGVKRKRRYYRITQKGIEALETSMREWELVSKTLKKAMALQAHAIAS